MFIFEMQNERIWRDAPLLSLISLSAHCGPTRCHMRAPPGHSKPFTRPAAIFLERNQSLARHHGRTPSTPALSWTQIGPKVGGHVALRIGFEFSSLPLQPTCRWVAVTSYRRSQIGEGESTGHVRSPHAGRRKTADNSLIFSALSSNAKIRKAIGRFVSQTRRRPEFGLSGRPTCAGRPALLPQIVGSAHLYRRGEPTGLIDTSFRKGLDLAQGSPDLDQGSPGLWTRGTKEVGIGRS